MKSVVMLIITVASLAAFTGVSAPAAYAQPNAGNVQLCKFIATDPGYPYTMTIFLQGGGVFGPVTVNNLGGCVSSLARNKDWETILVISD